MWDSITRCTTTTLLDPSSCLQLFADLELFAALDGNARAVVLAAQRVEVCVSLALQLPRTLMLLLCSALRRCLLVVLCRTRAAWMRKPLQTSCGMPSTVRTTPRVRQVGGTWLLLRFS